SNIKAAGFLKWAGLYGTGDTRAKDLDEVAVGTLLRDEQMSETEARSRFAKMGYSQDDVDYLIILNLPG
ncbi:MAG: hypothetical protein JRI70_09710, partial [Deltaproteobacteria bacterium]|nr:hypothetical protein [Deltaproteobacteria bacterium]